MVEQVLVVPTVRLHEAGLFHGLSSRVEHYLPRLLDADHLRYVPRPDAENDPALKQIIPYVVLRHGDRIFHYRRGQGAGEARLRALRSVGVGGHINPGDQGDDPYRQGMLREVHEEVFLETGYRETCLGLINDDTTPVGQVHLGIVHIFDLERPDVRRRERDIAESGFAPVAELRAQIEEFETWSRFVLDALAACDCLPRK